MSSAIELTLQDPGKLYGMKTIDILVDGDVRGQIEFGSTERIECEAGNHVVQLVLRALMERRSNSLQVAVPGEGDACVTGTYSRLWGNIRLESHSA